jgi:hypothetical protein
MATRPGGIVIAPGPHPLPVFRARFKTAIEAGHSWGCASCYARLMTTDLIERCICPIRATFKYRYARQPI